MSDVYTLTLSRAELDAINEFWSYGATRGNHAEVGDGPGPLTKHIAAMSEAARKAREARPYERPDHWLE